jgi:hypothetical protein
MQVGHVHVAALAKGFGSLPPLGPVRRALAENMIACGSTHAHCKTFEGLLAFEVPG